jgi:hypothetical protein
LSGVDVSVSAGVFAVLWNAARSSSGVHQQFDIEHHAVYLVQLQAQQQTLASLSDRIASLARASMAMRTVGPAPAASTVALPDSLLDRIDRLERTVAASRASEPEPTGDQVVTMQQVFEQGQRLLAEARRSKLWNQESHRRFHGILAAVSPEQRDQLQLELAKSINDGSLVVNTSGPAL